MFSKKVLLERYRDDPGALALVRLLQRVTEHDGGSTRPIAGALRNMHNGEENHCDLELVYKRLERQDFLDVLAVLRFANEVFERDGIELYKVFVDRRVMERVLFC